MRNPILDGSTVLHSKFKYLVVSLRSEGNLGKDSIDTETIVQSCGTQIFMRVKMPFEIKENCLPSGVQWAIL